MTTSNNSLHGKEFQKKLLNEMMLLASMDKLKAVLSNVGVRHPGYSSPGQYYAPILITVASGDQWALFTTTTCRTDRIKGQQWDAEHLKMFCPTIKRACLIYPDEISSENKNLFISQRRKYENRWEYSCLDRIESLSELIKEIENV